MIRGAANMTEIRELARARRFRLCMPSATVTTTGGLPEIHLSWAFLVAMAIGTDPAEWRSYLEGEDEVKIRD